jgi:dTDP-glucose 4,6-dehydratase
MKILVLGASSFSGGWFVDVAKAAGHSVRLLSRPAFDLCDFGESAELVGKLVDVGYDAVVNYAALNVVPDSWTRAPDYYRTNVVGIAYLSGILVKRRLRRFVQVSTPEVYGSTGTFLKEGAPFDPSTPYAVSRAAADTHLRLMHREWGLPVCFTRTVNVYGERQQAYRIIPKAARCALSGTKLPLEGGGVSTRSFLHAEDAARATLRVLEDGRPGEDYHIAHPGQVRIRHLVNTICERLGRAPENVIEDVPERVGKDMNYQLDDSKIRSELGWRESISLDAGLDRTLAWIVASEAKAA